MSEDWASHIVIQLRTYNDLPAPEALEEAAELGVEVGDRIDRAEVVGTIREGLLGRPHFLRDTYHEDSWGADNAFLTIFLEASAATASMAYLIELVVRAVAKVRRGEPNRKPNEDRLREWSASVLDLDVEDVQVTKATRTQSKVGIEIDTPLGTYRAEDGDKGRRLRPQKPKKDGKDK